MECTRFGLENNKVVKWIIEIAALNDHEIVQLSALVKNIVLSNFEETCYTRVFVKSSTGFYKTRDGIPNGATLSGIKLMLENSFPLPVKAAGGVRTIEEAEQMISLGVKRIGTSSAFEIVNGLKTGGGILKRNLPVGKAFLFIANFVSGFYFFFIAMFPNEIFLFLKAT